MNFPSLTVGTDGWPSDDLFYSVSIFLKVLIFVNMIPGYLGGVSFAFTSVGYLSSFN
jgi:hypothetical protein